MISRKASLWELKDKDNQIIHVSFSVFYYAIANMPLVNKNAPGVVEHSTLTTCQFRIVRGYFSVLKCYLKLVSNT